MLSKHDYRNGYGAYQAGKMEEVLASSVACSTLSQQDVALGSSISFTWYHWQIDFPELDGNM